MTWLVRQRAQWGQADGAIPVFHRAYDGAAGEVGQVIGAMQAPQKLAGPQQVLMVGDSKPISYANLAAMTAAGVGFIAQASSNMSAPRLWPV
ncbi:hypothetical protein ACQEVF_11730 [Nonomuraea polychroma]|uniref:hypothetical protein n=1 Tax=Nonomuraea polychroma TaxID=46176 RepID=UPI003D921DAC